jgi:hypothetical protein
MRPAFPPRRCHRLLEWRARRGELRAQRRAAAGGRRLIVDEASMCDVRLGADLVAALPPSRAWCWWATSISSRRSARGPCSPT